MLVNFTCVIHNFFNIIDNYVLCRSPSSDTRRLVSGDDDQDNNDADADIDDDSNENTDQTDDRDSSR